MDMNAFRVDGMSKELYAFKEQVAFGFFKKDFVGSKYGEDVVQQVLVLFNCF